MNPLLEVKNLEKKFSTKDKDPYVIKKVSFQLHPLEILGLVGESGCGKSTLARCLLRLEQPTQGQILFKGQDIHSLKEDALFSFRKEAQLIFQDPYSALNPRMTAGENIAEPLLIHRLATKKNVREQATELLNLVGLCDSAFGKYPHQFSGGQRQRIVIARALALKPKLIVCDEPISSLDMSVQAQIVNLLKKLQKEFQMTYLFIAHDLNMIKYISDRVAVMHQGTIIECGNTDEVYSNPQHPYTKKLLSSIL